MGILSCETELSLIHEEAHSRPGGSSAARARETVSDSAARECAHTFRHSQMKNMKMRSSDEKVAREKAKENVRQEMADAAIPWVRTGRS